MIGPYPRWFHRFICTSNCRLSERDEIERSTRGQSGNPAWMLQRKNKITASIVGQIMSLRPTTVPTSLIDTITQTNKKDLSHLPAIRHGNLHEAAAREKYEELFTTRVEERGFLTHPQYSWLGCSVDGFIDGPMQKTLEIKCPMIGKNDSVDSSLESMAATRKGWFLELVNGGLSLRKSNKYYYQCMTQMMCTGVSSCDFFVYLVRPNREPQTFCQTITLDPIVASTIISKCQHFRARFLV